MRIDLFGRKIVAEKKDGVWRVFYLGPEGKRRLAGDLVIPESVMENEVVGYLDDLFHEMATESHPCVRLLR